MKSRIVRRFFRAVLMGLTALSVGCAGVSPAGGGAAADQLPSAPSYRLQSGDEIDVQIYREPQLSGKFRIDSAGRIHHPLAGPFQAGGLTVAEAEAGLAGVLGRDYLNNPRVVVTVLAAQSAHIVVLGEVKNPGTQTIQPGQNVTLLKAIAEAGGFTDLASVNRVTLVRTIDGKEQSIRVRVERLLKGEEPDVTLQPNDVIMVPQIIF